MMMRLWSREMEMERKGSSWLGEGVEEEVLIYWGGGGGEAFFLKVWWCGKRSKSRKLDCGQQVASDQGQGRVNCWPIPPEHRSVASSVITSGKERRRWVWGLECGAHQESSRRVPRSLLLDGESGDHVWSGDVIPVPLWWRPPCSFSRRLCRTRGSFLRGF